MDSKIFKVFLLSDRELIGFRVRNFLTKFPSYELTVVPTMFNEFELFKYNPDVVIMDQKLSRIINCYQWDECIVDN